MRGSNIEKLGNPCKERGRGNTGIAVVVAIFIVENKNQIKSTRDF